MSNCIRRIVLGAALLAGIAMAANAQTVTAAGENPGRQIAALPPPEAAAPANNIALPEVMVLAPRTYPQPYANGGGPRVSSYSIPRSEHYQTSPDYATDPALHPYSSGLGPRASSQGTVRAEHYQVPPDYDQNVAMHPYTSGHGPCPQGGAGKVVCTDMIPSSHHNR